MKKWVHCKQNSLLQSLLCMLFNSSPCLADIPWIPYTFVTPDPQQRYQRDPFLTTCFTATEKEE